MRAFVPIAIITAAAFAVYLAVPDGPPPKPPETFGEYARKYCSVEATAPRRQDCYDRMIVQKAFELSNSRFEQARRNALSR